MPSWEQWYGHLRAWSLPGVVMVCAALAPRLAEGWFGRWEARLGALARRTGRCGLALAGGMVAVRLLALPLVPVPAPAIHDEFSYLLAADTFAHGRLTNPTPELWRHFETFHELMTPSYASIYPPGQGMVMALGQAVAGNPYWGVVLSTAAMCAAIYWGLQAWIGGEWALVAAWLAALIVGPFNYWGNSYWGGAVAAAGGALALGAAPRILRAAGWRAAAGASLVLGAGLTILANSRPYEGLVVALPLAAMLVAWMLGRPRPAGALVWGGFILPLAGVLGLAGAGLAYYCWRVTGHPLRLPYLAFEAKYEVAPRWVWQPLAPVPHYDFEVLRQQYAVWEVGLYQQARAFPLRHILGQLQVGYDTFLWPLLSVPLAFATLTFTRHWERRTVWLTAIVGCALAGFMVEVFSMGHYLAPATAAIYGCVALALRRLRQAGTRGRFLVRGTVLASVVYFIALPVAGALLPGPEMWSARRMAVVRQLDAQPGPQLVFVHYPAGHQVFFEWVFNAADMDAAKIVWARDLGPAGNAPVLAYYSGRRAWRLEGDDKAPQLRPYAAAAPAAP